jgi:protein gp88
MALLSVSADAKTVKGEARGYLTGILYLAPHTLAGVGNLCADASAGCREACLFSAGRGVFKSVWAARVAKTKRFHHDRAAFMTDLVKDIAALARKAKRLGMVPVVRLNGTSDLPWENISITSKSSGEGSMSLFAAFPDVQFYDYTKSFRRAMRHAAGDMPANYHLTFSRSECNDEAARNVLARGGNVAVVFSTKKSEALPEAWAGYPVVNGDASDLRFSDPRRVVVGLKAKGRARKDASGFVVNPNA